MNIIYATLAKMKAQREANRRDAAYSLAERALRLMQESHDNRYFTWRCVSETEREKWYAKARLEIKHGRQVRCV